ncbi:hypothetical protein [Maritimibacter sp. 55A14]|uniref:hypothetical protein n=1 Tax=Maritimibacter sp. 55A14 TaxID=2174844 RepID=UPI0011B236A0|nr:hypothetical protein [Maritimibacter sp. 55A14]
MTKKISDIKKNSEKILNEFALERPNWKYVKSRRSFVRPVSSNASVEIHTGLSSKVDFINFEFGIEVAHRLGKAVGKALSLPKPYSDLILFWHRQNWIPVNLAHGRCTVHDNDPFFDDLRDQGKIVYVRIEEFPERLEKIFTLAEAEIDRIFDISSEEALIQSIVEKPIGFFRPNEVLVIQLMLGNSKYYNDLVEFYSQPIESIRSLTKHSFSLKDADRVMEIFREGNFPKFDFV